MLHTSAVEKDRM